ncbi:PREDICTED: transmembrane protein 238-like [Gekko japonicus]|uniref:Transmembrane protein 238-like n=1 Tax=Gekko japonicus TaxID=146911 RepID=A0ABM1KB93_GEKJA|nr:PREDICTED: transmembrane protein 238-like [Gekko japonicus]
MAVAASSAPIILPRRRRRRRVGRCAASFWLALAFDAVGLAILLGGVFADVFFSDLLIYGGGIGIFLSLVWWVFWYVGNLEVPPAELQDDVGLSGTTPRARRVPAAGAGGQGLGGSVRSLGRRVSGAFHRPRGGASNPRVVIVRSTAAVALELEPVCGKEVVSK